LIADGEFRTGSVSPGATLLDPFVTAPGVEQKTEMAAPVTTDPELWARTGLSFAGADVHHATSHVAAESE
jgi:hypothetical protein